MTWAFAYNRFLIHPLISIIHFDGFMQLTTIFFNRWIDLYFFTKFVCKVEAKSALKGNFHVNLMASNESQMIHQRKTVVSFRAGITELETV